MKSIVKNGRKARIISMVVGYAKSNELQCQFVFEFKLWSFWLFRKINIRNLFFWTSIGMTCSNMKNQGKLLIEKFTQSLKHSVLLKRKIWAMSTASTHRWINDTESFIIRDLMVVFSSRQRCYGTLASTTRKIASIPTATTTMDMR